MLQNLRMSKKSSTFAPAFEKQSGYWCPLVYRYYTGFWFREARFDSSVDNKGSLPQAPPYKEGCIVKKARVMEYTVLSNTNMNYCANRTQ